MSTSCPKRTHACFHALWWELFLGSQTIEILTGLKIARLILSIAWMIGLSTIMTSTVSSNAIHIQSFSNAMSFCEPPWTIYTVLLTICVDKYIESFNTWWPGQNGHYFTDDICSIFWHESGCILSKMSLFFSTTVQSRISRNWYRKWLGAKKPTSHYLKQLWPCLPTYLCVTQCWWVHCSIGSTAYCHLCPGCPYTSMV